MFNAFKQKLKNVFGKFSKQIEKEVETEELPVQEKPAEPVDDKKQKAHLPEERKRISAEEKQREISQKKAEKKEQLKKEPEEIQIEPEEESEQESVEEFEEEIEEKPEEESEEESVEEFEEESKKESEQTPEKEEHKLRHETKLETKHEIISEAKPSAEPEKKEELHEKKHAEHDKKKKSFFGIFRKKDSGEEEESGKEQPEKHGKEEEKPGKAEKTAEPEDVSDKKKSSFMDSFTKFNLSEEKFEELFWELEVMLLENNVAVEVIEKIKDDLKKDLTSGRISRKGVDEFIADSLRKSIEELFDVGEYDLLKHIRAKKDGPFIIAFIGVNGSGKTTTMAKLAYSLQKSGLSVVFAAADTFRAAAIQQLGEHADKLGIKMIKHDYGSDPAAVAFDAVKHAKAKGIDVVLIDTAGRMHNNEDLMRELEKLIRVNNPDLKLFIGEAITGNDCVAQAEYFNSKVGIDAIILAKADIDEKGGAFISVSYVTKKPIIYIGTGQTYDDLKPFDKNIVMEGLGV
ncbi:MAG: signal recognition particle-docking protein FtsY [Candidatus Woesearchaeota archaeon]